MEFEGFMCFNEFLSISPGSHQIASLKSLKDTNLVTKRVTLIQVKSEIHT